MSKANFISEAREIYDAISKIMADKKIDYCQSWWMNKHNHEIGKRLSTSKINTRCQWMVRKGYLKINKSMTSTSTGTCYQLTELKFNHD